MMVPEAWQNDSTMPLDKKAFYRYNSFAMEPWDGPALLAFSDGRYVGAVLDRNGLRPSRYYLTAQNYLYMASEVGIATIPADQIVQKVCDIDIAVNVLHSFVCLLCSKVRKY